MATEALIRQFQAEVDPHTLLVAADDVFEATDVPALLVQGPTLVEDASRRTLVPWVTRDTEAMTYAVSPAPRRYHLDFDLVMSTGTERTLLTLIGQIAALYQRHPVLMVEDVGALPLTELTPLGGMRRVNVSNLRQASGRCRIEDCPVVDTTALGTGPGRLVGRVIVDGRAGGSIE